MERPRQLPLPLGHPKSLSRDDLVVTPANAEAVALIDRWPDWPAAVVLLVGPAGAGKSHLASVWAETAGAAALAVDWIDASPRNMPVLIDDVDSPALDEQALFHLVNSVRAASSHLLLTARRPPGAWGLALPDLASRMHAAAVVELGEPDDALLAGVITKLFADRQVEIEANVAPYLVRRIERSLSTAIRVVDRLDRMALEQKVRITRALAALAIDASDYPDAS